ncbi:MAG: hypothetical protein ABF665_03950 [Gluconacetobacter sp.]
MSKRGMVLYEAVFFIYNSILAYPGCLWLTAAELCDSRYPHKFFMACLHDIGRVPDDGADGEIVGFRDDIVAE